MILIDDILISDEIIEKKFLCSLQHCKGACCIEGDGGAPLEEEEADILLANIYKIFPYITDEGKEAILQQGVAIADPDTTYSELATPLIQGGACAYIAYTDEGIASCGIENAFRAGSIDFLKPISCHLYPIRMKKMDDLIALNYDHWDICKSACSLGQTENVAVYQFLKEPLIRKFGEEFYITLENIARGESL